MTIKDKYLGKNHHRYNQHPLEEEYAEQWQEECEKGTLEYVLSGPINERVPVSDEAQAASNSVIQWLGSPVGQGFLIDVLKTTAGEEFLRYMVMDSDIRKKIIKML